MADLDLSEYNGASLVGTAVTFLILSWISVFLRVYVRIFMMGCFQLDDYFMVIGQIIFTLSCSFILLGVGRGIGQHNAALEQGDEIASLMWQALATATYVIDMMFIKLSIGIFLLRLAVQNVYRYILWGSLAIVAVWSTVLFFWNIFQCRPVAAQWDYTLEGASCVAIHQVVAAAYALSVMCILSDWLYALIPIPMLWNVGMTKQTKITVIVILGLGIFASVATLVRLRFLADLEETDDILYAGTDAMVWTLVEPGVAITAASLATIRPLLRAWRVAGFDSTRRTGRSSGGRSGGRSARGGTLDMEGPKGGGVELGAVGEKGAGRAYGNFSRPMGQKGSGRGRYVEGRERTLAVSGVGVGYAGEDVYSVSSFDIGRDAHSQDSGRVGLGAGGR